METEKGVEAGRRSGRNRQGYKRFIRVWGWAWAVLGGAIWGAGVAGAAGGEPVRTFRSTQVVADVPYLQEVGRQVPMNGAAGAVAAHDGVFFVGTREGVLRLGAAGLVAEAGMTSGVVRLVSAGGALWAMGEAGLHRREGAGAGQGGWERVDGRSVSDVAEYRGEIVAASGSHLFRVRGGRLEAWSTNAAPFGVARLVPQGGLLYVQGAGRLTTFSSGRFGGFDAYGFRADQGWDWGEMPSRRTRDALARDGAIEMATDRGLAVVRGMSLTSVRGVDGLPFEDLTCLARGFTNDLWMGTSRGVIRWLGGGEFQYFAGVRWLPDDRVNAVAVAGRTVVMATERGLGILEYEPYTLAKKAAYYERHLEEWGQKRLGFVHKLEWDAGLGQFVREISDNDGGYSGNYLAAQAYRYAVTGDPEARREATNTFHSLRWLEAMTGIPGFPARSVWVKGERGHQAGHGSGGYSAEWHDTADGRFEWKGDTSSDEICSQFYSIGLFLDLVADAAEAGQAKRHLARVAAHLMENGWRLIDKDGKPTRWGRWDPEYFLGDEGKYDRALQAVEVLSFLKTAEVATGDERFAAGYRQLVALGYPDFTLRARNTFPPDSILHFLDELAFWCWWNLLRLEQDPDLRALYMRGYERSYEVVRVERNPWFNYLYGALTGNRIEADASVEHLRAWPLDLRAWSYQNSHRADLRTPAGHVALKGGTRTFVPRETEPMRWDRWLMQADGGEGGRDVVEPAGWLLAYWMGRYHGFIGAPETTDPGLLTVRHSLNRELGAKPYDGPARPEVP